MLAAEEAACPKDLKGRAATEWRRLAPELVAKGVLTIGDRAMMLSYCQLTAEVEQCARKVQRLGLQDAIRLGYAGHLVKLRMQHRQYAAELGLSPSSRSGVKAVKRVDPADERRKRFFGIPGGQAKP